MRKILILAGTLMVSGFSAITIIQSAGGVATLAVDPNASTVWMHYKQREATEAADGIREYWSGCGLNSYSFTKPATGQIKEAASYNTDGFSADDPRWIKWVSDDCLAFYDTSDSSIDCSEVKGMSGTYATSEAQSADVGSSSRHIYVKDSSSPAYCVNTLSVSKIIDSNDDLNVISSNVTSGTDTGYYVITADLDSPSANVSSLSSASYFSGTLDGRGHTINNPCHWGYRLLGRTQGATIKNINYTNIAVFSVLASILGDNTVIEDCSFKAASSLSQWSNVGFICDSVYSGVSFKDVLIDFGEASIKLNGLDYLAPAIAKENLSTPTNPATYENVVFHGLSSTNMYQFDSYSRSLRPEGITYESSYPFIANGSSSYSIAYLSSSAEAKTAATFVQNKISSITGVTLPLENFDSKNTTDDGNDYQQSKIFVGDASLATYLGASIPSEYGSFSLLSAGKGIFLFSDDTMGYQAGALKLLNALVGYRYIGDQTETNTYSNNYVDLPYLRLNYAPSFGLRKCDWSDGVEGDPYSWGYNQGHGDYQYYLSAPAIGDLSEERFHTSLLVLYPGTYYSSHPSWYAVDGSGSTYGEYRNWQLCYTAHGDSTEYQAMLNQAAEYVKNLYSTRTNLNLRTFMFGIADNWNYCHCSACTSATSTYGSIAGTVANFVNDLRDLVIPSLSEAEQKETKLGFFAYQSYEKAPFVDGAAKITLNDNVFCLAAPITANYTYPLTASCNASSKETLEQWAQVGDMSVWLYDTNFLHYLYPFNSFEANHDNLVYLKGLGVKMVYLQGQHSPYQPRTGFNCFKKFLAAQTMMDASQSYASLKDEFFASYYGEAGQTMENFFDQMVVRLKSIEENSAFHDTLYDESKSYGRSIYENISNADFWDFDELKGWVSDCEQASSTASSSVAKRHIKIESIFPRMALCELYDASKWNNESELTAFRKAFKADCEELGISYFKESGDNSLSTYYSTWGIA